jgi:hypothetical protein
VERICGFIVVRKPEYASTELVKPNMKIGENAYYGVDRFRWEDLDLAYYDRRLPPELLPIWQELKHDTVDFSGLKLTKDFQKAKQVLEFSEERSEIIAIWSPELEGIKGAIHCELKLSYLGIDCFSMGEWSVLLGGVYVEPEYFTETALQLNEHGVLNSDAECNAAFVRYLELASSGIVEPLMDGAKATNIRVFNLP